MIFSKSKGRNRHGHHGHHLRPSRTAQNIKPKLLSFEQRRAFYKHCHHSMQAGINLKETLSKYVLVLADDGRSSQLVAIQTILGKFMAGSDFHAAAEGYLPDADRELFSIASAAGSELIGFGLLVEQTESINERGQGHYFGLLYGLGSLAIAFYVLKISGDSYVELNLQSISTFGLPASVEAIIFFARHFDIVSFIFTSLLVGGFFFIRWSLPRWTGPVRTMLDKYAVPYILYRRMEGAKFLTQYATLLHGGILDKEAMEAIVRKSRPWKKQRVQAILARMKDGQSLGRAAREAGFNFPDKYTAYTLDSIAQNDAYSEKLLGLAKTTVKDEEARLNRAMTLLHTFIIILALTLSVFSSLTMNRFASEIQKATYMQIR